MSKHRTQIRHAPALLDVYPIEGHNALRPSGRPDDPPEFPRDCYYEPKSADEQREWDAYLRGGDPSYFKANKQHWAYWDQVRKLKTLTPRARKRAIEREERRRKP